MATEKVETTSTSKTELTKEQREAKVKQILELGVELNLHVVSESEKISDTNLALLNDVFQMQREFPNFSKFLPEALATASIMYAKYIANQRVNDFERLIQKTQKNHKEFNREQALTFIRETRSGKEMEELATYAEAVRTKLS